MTAILERMYYNHSSKIASETFYHILSAGTIYEEGSDEFGLLYYNGAFDTFYGFNGVCYEPLPVHHIRHKFKELLSYCFKELLSIVNRAHSKIGDMRPSPAKEGCSAAWSNLGDIAMSIIRKLGSVLRTVL